MNQSLPTEKKQLFFCFGPPKSGTTFLQRTLNLHPDVSCPSEHQFNIYIKDLENILKNYHTNLKAIDKRTGGQGILPISEATFKSIVRHSIETLMKDASRNGEAFIGANDNNIRKNLPLFNDIFAHPKMIYLIRNPADMAISAWHHNHRLAKEENNPVHLNNMTQYGDFDDWVRQYAKWFTRDISIYRKFSKNNKNIIMVRYEDMVSEKRITLHKIFDFLGTKKNENILETIEKESDFSYMRDKSNNPAFFRSATTNMGAGIISHKLKKDIIKISGDALNFLDYKL